MTDLKKRKKLLAEARHRFRERAQTLLRARSAIVAMQPEPRYDQVYEDAMRCFDELHGGHIRAVVEE